MSLLCLGGSVVAWPLHSEVEILLRLHRNWAIVLHYRPEKLKFVKLRFREKATIIT